MTFQLEEIKKLTLESEKIEPRKPIEDKKFTPTDTTKQKDLFTELPDVSRGFVFRYCI